MKIAVVSYRYRVDRSPTVKGIVRFLVEQGFAVDLFVESIDRDTVKGLGECTVKRLGPQWITALTGRISGFGAKGRARASLLRRVKRIMVTVMDVVSFVVAWVGIVGRSERYSFVYCIEAHSLNLLHRTGSPFNNVVYFSLELDQVLLGYGKRSAASRLSRCVTVVVQSPKRARLLNEWLRTDLDCQFLPVSLAPSDTALPPRTRTGPIRLVYSGYLARWSYLYEFLEAYQELEDRFDLSLTIQGHREGAEAYAAKTLSLCETLQTARFDDSAYSDSDHRRFLAEHEIGVGLYRDPGSYHNWQGLLHASGKIASYLWSGLAVLTNITDPETNRAPFLYMPSIEPAHLASSLHAYGARPKQYQRKARAYAAKYFDLYMYMEAIHSSLGLRAPAPRRTLQGDIVK